jgi:hypothetical protein
MKLKRALDIAVSFMGLAALAPLLLAIALAVWLYDLHSPFFRGMRVGQGGAGFPLLKFRSMRPDAWKSGANSTASSDTRITWIGRFLRATKLDELPQLWNVLVGDMSLVGPRPQVVRDAALYTDEESQMLAVRPGITDLASIVFADEGADSGGQRRSGPALPPADPSVEIAPGAAVRGALERSRRSGNHFPHGVGLVLARPCARRSGPSVAPVEGPTKRCATSRGRRDPLTPFPPPGARSVVERYREIATRTA